MFIKASDSHSTPNCWISVILILIEAVALRHKYQHKLSKYGSTF
jgi:hypothetical protein